MYHCLLLYILSHGFAVDDTKIHMNVGLLEDIWLHYALFLSDAKAGSQLARSC